MKKIQIIFLLLLLLGIIACKEKLNIEITNSKNLTVGEKVLLQVSTNATGNIEYSVDDDTLALVSDGYLIAKKAGTVNLTAYLETDSSVIATVAVTINNPELELGVDTLLLDYEITASIAANVTLSSLNSDIIEVKDNKLKALKVGVATIEALVTYDNDVTYSKQFTVEVKDGPTILLSRIAVGQIKDISVGEDIAVTSLNPDLLEIKDGKVRAKAAGTAIIEAKVNYSNQTSYAKTYQVEVYELSVEEINELQIGQEKQIIANTDEVTYQTTSECITITKTGLIKALSVGQAIVDVILDDSDVVKQLVININDGVDLLKEAASKINLDEEELVFPEEIEVDNKTIDLTWSIPESMYLQDILYRGENDIDYTIPVVLTYGNQTYDTTISLTISSLDKIIAKALDSISLPSSTDKDLALPANYKNVDIEWYSSSNRILSSEGILSYVESAVEVTLTATLIYGFDWSEPYFYDQEYVITALPYDDITCIEKALLEVTVPEIVSCSFKLPDTFKYGVYGVWESSDEWIINNLGHVSPTTTKETARLTLKLFKSDDQVYRTKTYLIDVEAKEVGFNEKYFNGHNFIDKASTANLTRFSNVTVENDRVVLNDGENTGYYESLVYRTAKFEKLTASWSAITDKTRHVEVEVRVRVNGVWSKYFTYGEWGLGYSNMYYNQDDTHAKMSVDEIIAKDGLMDGFQYKVTLARESPYSDSPAVLLVAIALKIPNYYYGIDDSALPKQIDYDVPKLNQNVVPTIGSVICSATTTTMLLKYKGFDFSGYDQYEHRYIANLVKDEGHNSPTYGNWTFNMAVAGAYGLEAYVARMYSWEELKHHLATVGPVGASIGGNFGLYTTGGHLIVVRGYREENGKTTVITNDPNVNERFGSQYFVYYEVTLEMFMNVWGGIVYVVK